MPAMNGLRRGACLSTALACVAATVVAGCGSSNNNSGGRASSGESSAPVKAGGKLQPASTDWPAPQAAVAPRTGSGTPIKIGVLSDCQGAFGSFETQALAGVRAAMSRSAGAKPKNPNLPRAGWTGGAINGHPLKLVGIGCSND